MVCVEAVTAHQYVMTHATNPLLSLQTIRKVTAGTDRLKSKVVFALDRLSRTLTSSVFMSRAPTASTNEGFSRIVDKLQ